MAAVRSHEVAHATIAGEARLGEALLTQRQRAYLTARRPLDVLLSLVLLVLCLPLLGVLAAAIMIDSPGGAFFSQERVGRGGKTFTLYKLRSMVRDAPPYMSKVGTDNRYITRVGRLLRLSGLDEVPQLFNVLRGDLNLIGPRPEMPFIVARFETWQHRRHELRPGITGWWQIHHRSGDALHLAIEDDLHYARNIGPLIDLHIAVRTVWVMVRGAVDALKPGVGMVGTDAPPAVALVED